MIKRKRQRIFLRWYDFQYLKEKDFYFRIEYKERGGTSYSDTLGVLEICTPPKEIFIFKITPLHAGKNYKGKTGIEAYKFIRDISKWNDLQKG